MFKVVKQIHFSYAHRITTHRGKCERYHGHNGVVEIECSASALNANQMVVDFDEISKPMKVWIDEQLDHRMILKEGDPLVDFLKRKGEKHVVLPHEPTAEAIAQLILDEARRAGLPVTRVTLWETPNSSATVVQT